MLEEFNVKCMHYTVDDTGWIDRYFQLTSFVTEKSTLPHKN